MAGGDVQVKIPNGEAPTSKLIDGIDSLIPKSVNAAFDGSGASGPFLPCLVITGKEGFEVARIPAPEVASGDTAEVSWFPRVSAPAASGGDYIFVTEQSTIGGNLSFTAIPQDARHLVIFMWFLSSGSAPGIHFNADVGTHYFALIQTVQDVNGAVTDVPTSTGPGSTLIPLTGMDREYPARITITIPYYRANPTSGFRDRSCLIECVDEGFAVSNTGYRFRRVNIGGWWNPSPGSAAPAITSIQIAAGGGNPTASLYKVM